MKLLSSILGLSASIVLPKIIAQLREQKIKVVHAMPGRLRLQCENWKHEEVVESFRQKLPQHPLISSVQASPITGSLTLKFTVSHISQLELDELLHWIVEIASNAIIHTEAKLMKGMKSLLQNVNHSMKRQTNGLIDVDSLIVLLLLTKGMHSLKSAPSTASRLLYWAYSIIKRKERK